MKLHGNRAGATSIFWRCGSIRKLPHKTRSLWWGPNPVEMAGGAAGAGMDRAGSTPHFL